MKEIHWPFRDQLADHDRNHRAEMADHGELTSLEPTAMDVSVAPAHRALTRAEIGARHIQEWLARGRAPGLIANERSKDIVLLQKHPAGRPHRFLSAPDIDAASDQSAAVKAG